VLLTAGPTWEWHDHRIHWTGEGSPADAIPPVNGKIDVREWEIGVTVAGTPSIVRGRLEFFVKAQTGGASGTGTGTILAIALPVAGVGLLGAGWLLVRRRRGASAAAA
jgi:hypothetical protein